MKTLQNDLTTIEQSKRLLELGVPKNSANHYYGKDGKLHYIDGTIPYSLLWATGCTPCWSVGRLIEIFVKARTWDTKGFCFNSDELVDKQVEYLVALFSENSDRLDFSKLEE